MVERNGLLLVLSSPSGAGKTTLSRMLLAKDPAFTLSISATTRPPRPGEVDGQDYFFVSKERFAKMIEGGELLEHADVFDHRYGTPRGPIEEVVSDGRDVLLDVDWQGAQQIKLSPVGRSVVSVFILPPSIAALADRLVARAQDNENVIAGRMSKAMGEIAHWAEYDYVLINDDLDQCFAQIETIVAGERLRLSRRPGLRGFVDQLNTEFEQRKNDADL
ncbi:MAG: guanylate kinase [Pseudomonadota bacterium]